MTFKPSHTYTHKRINISSYRVLAHFPSGQFNIPVNCLIQPSEFRLLRQPNLQYVEALKMEMLNNPTYNVAPLVGLVRISEGETFNNKKPEGYLYETIGGNHTRLALESLTKSEELPQMYRLRTVSVYRDISDEQAQHLAMRHNRATEFTNKMSTQDKVR